MAKSDVKLEGELLEVSAEANKVIPKLSTKVALGKANGNIIISFIFASPGEKPQLIERVILDSQLADELAELIKNMREVKNG